MQNTKILSIIEKENQKSIKKLNEFFVYKGKINENIN